MSTLAAILIGWALLSAGFVLGYVTCATLLRNRGADVEPVTPPALPTYGSEC
jgi:hypothetical protein